MTLIDHLLAIVLVAVLPISGYLSFQRLLRRAEAGETVDRIELYQQSTATQWSVFVAALAIWFFQSRSLDTLGFGLTVDTGFLIGVALVIAAVILLLLQIRKIRNASPEDISKFRGQFGRLEIMLPQNGNELRRFYGLSLTAGIVEETLWRGFMIWYFSLFFPLWAAATISILAFGIAHAYQGIEYLPKVTLLGAALAGLYVLTGSLWLPIVLHTLVDILQGRLVYEIIRRSDHGAAPNMAGDSAVSVSPTEANAGQ